LHGEQVVGCPLPFAPQLRPPSRVHFRVDDQAAHRGAEPQRGGDVRPISAFFVLRQDPDLPGDDEIVPVPASQAFQELLTHAHCFDSSDPSDIRAIVEAYLEFANCVPVFVVRYRPGFERLPLLVTRIVAVAKHGIEDSAPAPR
jgi:hypothetical protein